MGEESLSGRAFHNKLFSSGIWKFLGEGHCTIRLTSFPVKDRLPKISWIFGPNDFLPGWELVFVLRRGQAVSTRCPIWLLSGSDSCEIGSKIMCFHACKVQGASDGLEESKSFDAGQSGPWLLHRLGSLNL